MGLLAGSEIVESKGSYLYLMVYVRNFFTLAELLDGFQFQGQVEQIACVLIKELFVMAPEYARKCNLLSGCQGLLTNCSLVP